MRQFSEMDSKQLAKWIFWATDSFIIDFVSRAAATVAAKRGMFFFFAYVVVQYGFAVNNLVKEQKKRCFIRVDSVTFGFFVVFDDIFMHLLLDFDIY